MEIYRCRLCGGPLLEKGEKWGTRQIRCFNQYMVGGPKWQRAY